MASRGRPRHPDILTPREWEVLELLRSGASNAQIAKRLHITERTAKFHVSEDPLEAQRGEPRGGGRIGGSRAATLVGRLAAVGPHRRSCDDRGSRSWARAARLG